MCTVYAHKHSTATKRELMWLPSGTDRALVKLTQTTGSESVRTE